jgi:Phage gp6-like head-tail connector protein
MANWPTLTEVRAFLRSQPDPKDDAIIATSLAAAIDYGNRRLNYKYPPPPADGGLLPDSAHMACVEHAARLFRRRDSIDGTLGFGDQGVIRVGRADPDIDQLYAVVGPMVFG